MKKRLICALLLALALGGSLYAMEWFKKAAEYIKGEKVVPSGQEARMEALLVLPVGKEQTAQNIIKSYEAKRNLLGQFAREEVSVSEEIPGNILKVLKRVNDDLNRLYDLQLKGEIISSNDLGPIYAYRNLLEHRFKYQPTKKPEALFQSEAKKLEQLVKNVKDATGYYVGFINPEKVATLSLGTEIKGIEDLKSQVKQLKGLLKLDEISFFENPEKEKESMQKLDQVEQVLRDRLLEREGGRLISRPIPGISEIEHRQPGIEAKYKNVMEQQQPKKESVYKNVLSWLGYEE